MIRHNGRAASPRNHALSSARDPSARNKTERLAEEAVDGDVERNVDKGQTSVDIEWTMTTAA